MEFEEKQKHFINRIAEGSGYAEIAEELQINISTCYKWEMELQKEIEAVKERRRNVKRLMYASAKELPLEQSIFKEAWNIVKEYHNIGMCGTIKEWDQLAYRSSKLCDLGKGKAETEILSEGMALLVMVYLKKVNNDQKKMKQQSIKKP